MYTKKLFQVKNTAVYCYTFSVYFSDTSLLDDELTIICSKKPFRYVTRKTEF